MSIAMADAKADAKAEGDADVAAVAALIGDPSRAKVLMALLDGRSLAASVLAAEAGVSASTISEHLSRLVDAGLLTASRQGRSRFFRISRPDVADALEAIARIAPPEPIRSLRQGTHAHALRQARTCYNHLAGRLGVALMGGLLERGLLCGGDGLHHPEKAQDDRLSGPGKALQYGLTARGVAELEAFGIDLDAIRRRPPAIRYCLDWSEQRHHLAGPLGTAVTDRLFGLAWIRRGRARAVTLTEAGEAGLLDVFGVKLDA
jgi:DNA-binding transcriptional ArsR family regulator